VKLDKTTDAKEMGPLHFGSDLFEIWIRINIEIPISSDIRTNPRSFSQSSRDQVHLALAELCTLTMLSI